MIEIFLMVQLSKAIRKMMVAKGRSPGGYQFLAVALWIGGEITGAVIAASSARSQGDIYVGALLGAACGAALAFVIASSVRPLVVDDTIGKVFE